MIQTAPPTTSEPACAPLPRVLIVGAGPAGVCASMRLVDRGCDVTLVDRATFPREKICGCCLNLAALDALGTIACDHLVTMIVPEPLTHWQLQAGGRTVRATLPGGVAISRYAMDAALINESKRRGVAFRDACVVRVLDVDCDGTMVGLRDHDAAETQCRYDVVIFATGLSGGGVSKWLPYQQAPMGPIGVGFHLSAGEYSKTQVRPHTIHMVCGHNGYVGLVRLEDDSIDVAAAIYPGPQAAGGFPGGSRRDSIAQQLDAILNIAGLHSVAMANVDQLRMTPPLTRRRVVGCDSLLAIGDAAGYVQPFTGEGMAWAMESGIAVADCIVGHASQTARTEQLSRAGQTLAERWIAKHAAMSRDRQWVCKLISRGLASRPVRWAMVPSIRVAPWIASWTIGRLNRV